ncbi:hypothetical protein DFJ74DRAFT_435861 [Hyaloraphidium curvatum]|nr:hypothetical protein DFJ74DRAFT_435861 [Hyaloraphidium curvatum]
MTGDASEWATQQFNAGEVTGKTYMEFKTIVNERFADPLLKEKAQKKLDTMKQGNRPFTSYKEEFNKYTADSGYNDTALIPKFFDGLNQNVKTALAHQAMKMPTDLKAYQALCQTLADNHYLMIRSDGGAAGQGIGGNGTGANAAQESSHANAAQESSHGRGNGRGGFGQGGRGARGGGHGGSWGSGNGRDDDQGRQDGNRCFDLSREEYMKRRDENLCFKCGKSGHVAANCRAGKSEAKKKLQATMQAEEEEKPKKRNKKKRNEKPEESSSDSDSDF